MIYFLIIHLNNVYLWYITVFFHIKALRYASNIALWIYIYCFNIIMLEVIAPFYRSTPIYNGVHEYVRLVKWFTFGNKRRFLCFVINLGDATCIEFDIGPIFILGIWISVSKVQEFVSDLDEGRWDEDDNNNVFIEGRKWLYRSFDTNRWNQRLLQYNVEAPGFGSVVSRSYINCAPPIRPGHLGVQRDSDIEQRKRSNRSSIGGVCNPCSTTTSDPFICHSSFVGKPGSVEQCLGSHDTNSQKPRWHWIRPLDQEPNVLSCCQFNSLRRRPRQRHVFKFWTRAHRIRTPNHRPRQVPQRLRLRLVHAGALSLLKRNIKIHAWNVTPWITNSHVRVRFS